MRQVYRFFILASAAALVACATEAPAPAPANHDLAVVKPLADAHPGLNTYGYQRKVVNGQDMFCKNDLVQGSRVEREGETCVTADELKQMQENSQQFLDAVQGHGTMATATGTPGAGK